MLDLTRSVCQFNAIRKLTKGCNDPVTLNLLFGKKNHDVVSRLNSRGCGTIQNCIHTLDLPLPNKEFWVSQSSYCYGSVAQVNQGPGLVKS